LEIVIMSHSFAISRGKLANCLVFGFCLVVCVGIAFLTLWPERRHGPFWDRYQKVQLGMTQEQVKDILGPPTAEIGGGLSSGYAWVWQEGEQTIGIDFTMNYSEQVEYVSGKRFQPESWWENLLYRFRD
jgi:hypothetical protein